MDIKALQRPLRDRYASAPDSAPITLSVRSAPTDLADPLHCTVTPDSTEGVVWRSGAHPAVGGADDVPCSGDLLLAALAACQEVTLRMVAANLGLELTRVEAVAEGDWDPPIRNAVAIGSAFRIEAAETSDRRSG